MKEWKVVDRYDTKDVCQLAKSWMINKHIELSGRATSKSDPKYPIELSLAYCECLEGNDPRLKGK
jgi:hypothetical protein